MAVIKTWEIENISVLTSLFQQQDVVRLVNWKLTVQNDGENNTPPQIVYIHGQNMLSLPDPNTFIPYINLTQEQILNWLFESLGDEKHKFEQQAEGQVLQTLINYSPETMKIESKPLPW
jgi:hypothetical protein